MDKLSSIVELREMLRQMERDVGLADLNRIERDVFLVAHHLTSGPGDVVGSDQIRSHHLVSSVAQATYHRALRSLLKLGLLERASGSKAKLYVVRSDLVSK
jgi:hypothetical protein